MSVKASRLFKHADSQRNMKLGTSQKWFVVVFDKDGKDAISEIMTLALDGAKVPQEEGPSGMGIDSGSIRERM